MKLTKPQTEKVVAGFLGSIANTAVIALSVMLIWQVATEFEKVTNHHILLGFFFAVGLCILQAAALLGYAKGMIPKQLKESGTRGLLLFTCLITGLCSFVSFTRELDQYSLDWFTAAVICLAVPYLQFNTGPIAAWWSKLAGKEWQQILVTASEEAAAKKLEVARQMAAEKPVAKKTVAPTVDNADLAVQPVVSDTTAAKAGDSHPTDDKASTETKVFTYGEGGPSQISLYRVGDRGLIVEARGWSSNQVSKLVRNRFQTSLNDRVTWGNPDSMGDKTYRWQGTVSTKYKVKGVLAAIRGTAQELVKESS